MLPILVLLVPLSAAYIHIREPYTPPFLLGRPPGGHRKTLYHTYEAQEIKDTGKATAEYPFLQQYWFTQPLDQFDSTNPATWQQKYYYNPVYNRNNSIIFLMIGGEGPESGKWAANPNVQYLLWAKEYGAAVFDLEHRFFGESFPIKNMNTESLKYCTTEQALADIAAFIRAMNVQYGFINPRWVTFGGSYPGSLAAWFRSKYPKYTVGSVASSAPVNLKLDFYEYSMVVNDDLAITDPTMKCSNNVKTAFTQMQQLSMTKAGRTQLNNYFNIQPPFDDSTTKLDITNFLGNAFSVFQGMTQYTYDGQSSYTQRNITVSKTCDIMNNASVPDVITRVYNVYLWYNTFYPPCDPTDKNCDITIFYNSYWDYINAVGFGNVTADNADARGWMWLCCNEIGFLQTTDQGQNVFGSILPLNYYVDMCTDMFGPNINMAFIQNKNAYAQLWYGGADNYKATNVVLPNGSLDPWHALGTYNADATNHVTPILINGTAHCSDMYASYVGEPPVLVAARAQIKAEVEYFIKYNPAVDGVNNTVGSVTGTSTTSPQPVITTSSSIPATVTSTLRSVITTSFSSPTTATTTLQPVITTSFSSTLCIALVASITISNFIFNF